jgi:DNA-binding response OmpR family regulator
VLGLAAHATKFDLLIVNIMLPNKDGWQVVAELHADSFSYRSRRCSRRSAEASRKI